MEVEKNKADLSHSIGIWELKGTSRSLVASSSSRSYVHKTVNLSSERKNLLVVFVLHFFEHYLYKLELSVNFAMEIWDDALIQTGLDAISGILSSPNTRDARIKERHVSRSYIDKHHTD
ncbi:hypothetical protein FHL15_010507 [Xylaria flabelliformis]|uniref:Uncharacterized protein n=1 Tax=Xylaria flabelliformis TaxID=2512241 RepID=A0A553HKS8_9PEZI|nr:hypothetical protein FHL15_010507 [Xylaria flabelliformis]